MLTIPLTQNPSQTLTTNLDGQICQINVYQKFYGVFIDLYVSNSPIIIGVIAQNLNRIVRYKYLGFSGDLFFFDTQGSDDPTFDGLGDRWTLNYITQAELTALGLRA